DEERPAVKVVSKGGGVDVQQRRAAGGHGCRGHRLIGNGIGGAHHRRSPVGRGRRTRRCPQRKSGSTDTARSPPPRPVATSTVCIRRRSFHRRLIIGCLLTAQESIERNPGWRCARATLS